MNRLAAALRRDERELACGSCGRIFAHVTLRTLTGLLRIGHVEGYQLQPHRGALVLRQTEERLARAEAAGTAAGSDGTQPSAARRDAARARNDLVYLRREAGELIYEFDCTCGAKILRSPPDLVRDLRRAGGRWVSLS